MFPNNLRAKRVLSRMTQFDLRIKTGIHQSKVSLLENGYYKPTSEEQKKLAEALDSMVDELFPEKEARP